MAKARGGVETAGFNVGRDYIRIYSGLFAVVMHGLADEVRQES